MYKLVPTLQWVGRKSSSIFDNSLEPGNKHRDPGLSSHSLGLPPQHNSSSPMAESTSYVVRLGRTWIPLPLKDPFPFCII